jgi:hypothetical protein
MSGTAKHIRLQIAMKIALRADPIKSMFHCMMVREEKVVVTRPIVSGGGASLTPERGQARLISVDNEAHEFTGARYGVDVSMGLAGAQFMTQWKDELDVKLAAQHKDMDEAYISNAYRALRLDATPIEEALLMGDVVRGSTQGRERLREAAQIHADLTMIFQKTDFPMEGLMSAIAKAAVNTPAIDGQGGTPTLLVPMGCSMLDKYTQDAYMTYSVSGIKKDGSDIKVPMTSMRKCTQFNVNIVEHVPPLDMTQSDSSNPQAITSELLRSIVVATHHPIDDQTLAYDRNSYRMGIVDFPNKLVQMYSKTSDDLVTHINRSIRAAVDEFNVRTAADKRIVNTPLVSFDEDSRTFRCTNLHHAHVRLGQAGFRMLDSTAGDYTDAVTPINLELMRPRTVLWCESAIYCSVPGKSSAVMFFGYPQYGVSINIPSEELLVVSRNIFGAGIIEKRHFILIPDVSLHTIESGAGSKVAWEVDDYVCAHEEMTGRPTDVVLMAKSELMPWDMVFSCPLMVLLNCQNSAPWYYTLQSSISSADALAIEVSGRASSMPLIPFLGTVYNKDLKPVYSNGGHMGSVDSEAGTRKVGLIRVASVKR